MTTAELQQVIADPAEFRRVLSLPVPVDRLAPFQVRDFAQLDPAFANVAHRRRSPIQQYWLERTKGASKDSDLAALLLWTLAVSPHALVCQVAAADALQASELRKAALEMTRRHPAVFGKSGFCLEVQSEAIVNTRTGARLDILTSDVLGSHGARPDLLIINELVHHARSEFAETLLDNAAKIPHCLTIIATNAGWVDTFAWRFREMARTSPRWHFAAYDQPAPWIDAAGLEERRRTTSPSRFARLWAGCWIESGDGDALDADLLAAAFSLDGPMLSPQPGWTFAGGLDLGLTRDGAALVVVGRHDGHTVRTPKERPRMDRTIEAMIDLGMMDAPPVEEDVEEYPATGRLRVCECTVWRPPAGGQIDLSAVESAVAEAHRRYRFASVGVDPWQASLMSQRLARVGVPMLDFPPTPQNLRDFASCVLESVNGRTLEAYKHPDLVRDMKRLRLVERNYGVRLESPRDATTGHGDSASALANGLLALRRISAVAGPVDGELCCWPAA
jgi:hypothetical protein